MKKKNIIIGILLLFFAYILMIPIIARAKDDKTMTLYLPSNETYVVNYYFQNTYRDCIVLVSIKDLYIDKVNNRTSGFYIMYEPKEGITEDDLLFEITDELREQIKTLNNYSVDILEGYSKIQISFKEYDDILEDDTLIFDLRNADNLIDLPFYLVNAMEEKRDLWEFIFGDFLYTASVYNTDNKLLFSILIDEKNGTFQVNTANDVTSSNDVVYELTEDDKIRYHINKDRLVLKFGDKEYNENDYVVDFTQDVDMKDLDTVIEPLGEKGLLSYKRELEVINPKGKVILDSGELPQEYAGKYLTVLKTTDEFNYNDNVEVLVPAWELLEKEVKLIIIFKDPTFVLGADQQFDIYGDEKLTFKIDVKYEEFSVLGAIYIDDELVDKDAYTLEKENDDITRIIFNDSFSSKLRRGTHTIRAVADKGETTTSFMVLSTHINPDTGNQKAIFYIAIICVVSLGILITFAKRITRINI